MQEKCKIVVAMDDSNAIGVRGKLIYRLKSDLRHFKSLTEKNVVIMGRKTYESIGRALPKRTNIVLSRSEQNTNDKDIIWSTSLENALDYARRKHKDKPIFIIGGETLYEESLSKGLIDTMYITKIHATSEDGDTFFPKFDKDEWNEEILQEGEEKELKYTIVKLTHKNE